MISVLSNAEAGRCAPDHSAPGLGSRFSLMTPSVRSSVDYCTLGCSALTPIANLFPRLIIAIAIDRSVSSLSENWRRKPEHLVRCMRHGDLGQGLGPDERCAFA